jgi:hypothetical protein
MPDGHQTRSAKTDTCPRRLAEKVPETPTSSLDRGASTREGVRPHRADMISGRNTVACGEGGSRVLVMPVLGSANLYSSPAAAEDPGSGSNSQRQ